MFIIGQNLLYIGQYIFLINRTILTIDASETMAQPQKRYTIYRIIHCVSLIIATAGSIYKKRCSAYADVQADLHV